MPLLPLNFSLKRELIPIRSASKTCDVFFEMDLLYILYNIYICILSIYMRSDVFGSVLAPQNLSRCKTVHLRSFESKMDRHNFMSWYSRKGTVVSEVFSKFLKGAAIEDHMHCTNKARGLLRLWERIST